MLIKLVVILFLCAYIGVHSTNTDAAHVRENSVKGGHSKADDLSTAESKEKSDSFSPEEGEIQSVVEESLDELTEGQISSQEEVLKEQADAVESDDFLASEKGEEPILEEPIQEEPVQEESIQEEPVQEEPVQEEAAEDVPVHEEIEKETEDQVESDDVIIPEHTEEAVEEEKLEETPEESDLTEEDRAHNCIAREIDCHFTQPLTLYGIELSVNGAGKSAADICGELKEGDKCLQDILEGDCTPYLLQDEQLKRDQQAPVIKYLCDDNLQAVEENWQCLKTSLTEANLNTCSDFNPRTTCDVTKYVECLADQFSDECSEGAQELFKHFYTDLASLKLENCAEDFQVPKAKEGGGFFDFF